MKTHEFLILKNKERQFDYPSSLFAVLVPVSKDSIELFSYSKIPYTVIFLS